ncbi:hypothetical protein Igag_1330 [Ignisphaera aggregans DSM 17230]|uniref:Uncharacterized protein n=1 Tax=Ignisphaera aggregans (strain DSM 17230 / JCM 13409 / AQ1.S1) TaxID=583356 RepID=E0SQ02_IGNAA|nr:hypothetical protein Igag_1330 [Ignisphaera aggregans DSM 17230]
MEWIYIALLVIFIGIVLGLVIANELNILRLFDIGINVYVPEAEGVIEIKLDIRNASGSVLYPNITSLYLDRDSRIQFKLLSAEVEGDVRIALSGRATLVGVNGDRYSVSMPCLYTNIECFRILTLIPGYDTPMPLPRDRYSVSLELSWYGASGVGKIRLKLGIVKESDIVITKIGTKPENTTGWITFEGSTRTYAALIEPRATRVGDNTYAVHVWIWIFTPMNNTDIQSVDIAIEDYSGRQLYSTMVNLDRVEIYREALVRITLPQGRYVVKIAINPDIVLQTKLSIE